MRSSLRLAALVLVAVAASVRPAAAEAITFAYGWWGATSIGEDGFVAEISLFSFSHDNLGGGGEIRSDHLLRRVLGTADHPVSHYEFGPAMFTAELSYTANDGTVTHGTFAAPIVDLTVDLNDTILFLGGDGYGDPGVYAVENLVLQGGVFSKALAHALGIHRETLGGEIGLYIEGVGTPISERTRRGVSSTDVSIELVPEPPASLLVGLGLALLYACRGANRSGKKRFARKNLMTQLRGA